MMVKVLLGLFIALHLVISHPISADSLHFAIFTQRESDDSFWQPVTIFASEAAKQLNVKLTAFEGHSSKRQMLENVKKAKKLNVDAIISPNYGEVALQLIELSDELKLPLILFNADVTKDYIQASSRPQQKYKYWLASIMPSDFQAGYQLGKMLINQAREKNMGNSHGFIEVIAVNGTITDTPAQLRLAGLQSAIKEDGNSQLLQSVYAFWDKKTAYYKVSHLQPRYPSATVYWAASDSMAISANKALTEHGLKHGKDYVTGGIDWTVDGLTAIQTGDVTTSIGGHFMDGAWAVILLFDYFNGIDIEKGSWYRLQSTMQSISSDEVKLLLPHLINKDWSNINFRHYSKFYNRKLTYYPLSAKPILEQLKNP